MKKCYYINLLTFLLFLSFSLISCTSNKRIKKVVSLNYSKFSTLDCYKDTLGGVDFVALHVLERLVDIDKNGKIFPMLLKKLPIVSKDELTYSFELKKNCCFSDKTPVTSQDVKYSFERILWDEDSVAKPMANFIKGSDDVIKGKTQKLSGFKIIDDKRFEITLKQEFAPFVNSLTCTTISIYPRKKCQQMGSKWGKMIYGSGPYKVKKCDFKKEIVLERNKNFYGPKPKIDEILIKIIEDPSKIVADYKLKRMNFIKIPQDKYLICLKDKFLKKQIKLDKQNQIRFLMFNTKNKILSDVRVRKTISIAIARNEICNKILKGSAIPAHTYLPQDILGFDKLSKIEYDTEVAKKLLTEAGYPNGLTLNYYRRHDDDISIEHALVNMLAKVGIRVRVILAEGGDGFKKISSTNEYTMHTAKWTAGPDPDDFFYFLFHSSSNFPHRYKNNLFDQICEEGRRINNDSARANLYQKLDELLTKKDYVIAPISYDSCIYMSDKKLKGVYFHKSIGVEIFNEAYFD